MAWSKKTAIFIHNQLPYWWLWACYFFCLSHSAVSFLLLFQSKTAISLGGVTQIWVGQGCATRAWKPLSMFKGDFGRKMVPIFKDFSSKIGPFFKNFVIFGVLVRKVDPCLRIFLVKTGTHVKGFLVKKRPIRAAHPCSAKYVSTPPPGAISTKR